MSYITADFVNNKSGTFGGAIYNSGNMRITAYEETINELGRRDPNTLKDKLIDKMKEIAVLDSNYIKLNRKYKSLVEEEKTLREFVELNEKNNSEKEKKLKETITKLKK